MTHGLGTSLSGHHTETGRLCRPTAGLTVAPAPSRCSINVGCTASQPPPPQLQALSPAGGGPSRCPKARPPSCQAPDQGWHLLPGVPAPHSGWAGSPLLPARRPGASPRPAPECRPGECLRTRNADTSQGNGRRKVTGRLGPSLGGGGPQAQPMTRPAAQASDWSCRAGLPENVRLPACPGRCCVEGPS